MSARESESTSGSTEVSWLDAGAKWQMTDDSELLCDFAEEFETPVITRQRARPFEDNGQHKFIGSEELAQ